MTVTRTEVGPRPRGVAQVLVVVVVLLLAGVHMFATFARVAPPNPISSALAGPVSHHMEPLFRQGWAIFAPNPPLTDFRLWVRSAHLEGDALVATEWFDVTRSFLDQAHNQIIPPRHSRMAISLYRHQLAALNRLTDEQTPVVLNNYLGNDGLTRMHADLLAAGATTGTADQYVQSERMLIEFATNVAITLHPADDLHGVQVRTSSQGLIPWSQRNDPAAERPEEHFRHYGWREPIHARPTSQDAFVSVFRGFVDD